MTFAGPVGCNVTGFPPSHGCFEVTVKVVFDASNPGLWAFHCHNLFHMVAGMFATVVYDDFS